MCSGERDESVDGETEEGLNEKLIELFESWQQYADTENENIDEDIEEFSEIMKQRLYDLKNDKRIQTVAEETKEFNDKEIEEPEIYDTCPECGERYDSFGNCPCRKQEECEE